MESIMVKQIKTSCERQRKETGGKKTMKKLGGKQVLAGALSAAMVLGSAMPAMAATGWNQNTTGWWWENSDGSYHNIYHVTAVQTGYRTQASGISWMETDT